ncbi:MAG: alkaline phosphatase, partial [Planctomycetota bacterium]|nr:alkaline phosphatase [Planctomycetota bacterium]
MRRRTFLCGGTLLIAGNQSLAQEASPPSLDLALTIGLVTDVHYADKRPNGSRHYRESIRKIEEASDLFNRKKIDFAVEMG